MKKKKWLVFLFSMYIIHHIFSTVNPSISGLFRIVSSSATIVYGRCTCVCAWELSLKESETERLRIEISIKTNSERFVYYLLCTYTTQECWLIALSELMNWWIRLSSFGLLEPLEWHNRAATCRRKIEEEEKGMTTKKSEDHVYVPSICSMWFSVWHFTMYTNMWSMHATRTSMFIMKTTVLVRVELEEIRLVSVVHFAIYV